MIVRRGFLASILGAAAGSLVLRTPHAQPAAAAAPADVAPGPAEADTPLIITSNDPQVGHRRTDIEATIAAGVAAAQAGAAILHHHLIFRYPEEPEGRHLDLDGSVAVIEGLKERTGALVQLGQTLASNESRMAVARETNVDMFSITLADNDHYAQPYPPTIHRDREEMETLARFCLDRGIIPEWEIFHAGAVWNLLYLIKKGLAKPPFFVNLTMYPEGSSWAPRTFAEIDHRAAMLPEPSIWHLVAFARGVDDPVTPTISSIQHIRLLTYAILRGGHVRTGREDRLELRPGVPAESNSQLISEVVDLSRRLGRPVATPAQAREMLAIGRTR